MSRIKGKFVALLIINFNTGWKPGERPIEDIKSDMRNDVFANLIRELLEESVGKDVFAVTVEPQYVDVYEVQE